LTKRNFTFFVHKKQSCKVVGDHPAAFISDADVPGTARTPAPLTGQSRIGLHQPCACRLIPSSASKESGIDERMQLGRGGKGGICRAPSIVNTSCCGIACLSEWQVGMCMYKQCECEQIHDAVVTMYRSRGGTSTLIVQ
jgi:hypothetical protein